MKTKSLKESVFDFIISYSSSNGFPPTQAEIADQLGHNTRSAVQQALAKLETENKIVRIKGLSRSIKIV
jgi:SOS-response transcriptional repressor LexA|tara:strand:+ start:1890 stop:2096 length:207 start_codon:yes stop_codon:yes gene_type:complete